MGIEILAQQFQNFTHVKSSPLYAALSGIIATQPDILEALRDVPLQKSPRTIFLAAVHAILLQGIKHPLADFY
jgi:hypothetical protein